ncbi:glycoside hydrolase [Massariosphaeria phaeospora]|uniref:Glycoside hydrolase n=1 Tax=Massariosphaeria phaeospora TaxID=100035 RepID=A0A7C8IF00_9PLEO|nr:glycoside hydrolase [Massariosphaeria phaeospora]
MFAKLTLLLSTLPLALGHSLVADIWANGVHYNGWDPNTAGPYRVDTPGWYTTNIGGSPLYPIDANQLQIICARGGSNANFTAPVAAGSDVRLRWWQVNVAWPESHHGPVIDYIAPCNGPCSRVDPTTLKFVKLAQRGWINNSTYQEGYWASDELIADDGSWNVRIPVDLAPGEYVLRHEIIALHVAFTGTGAYSPSGAEFYPQCVNLNVTGSGTRSVVGGVDARELYRGDKPGLTLDIHATNDHSGYPIPGPPVWTGALAARQLAA